MKDNPGKKDNFHYPDQNIASHKFGCRIERFTAIIEENTGVYATVYNEEGNQEQSCKTHDEFASDGGVKQGNG